MNIWKLSCNSVDGSPYFDDFLRTEKIVLDWEALDYKIGDIVLIAKEYTIIALAKVVGIKTQITENKEYEEQCKKYGIDYLNKCSVSAFCIMISKLNVYERYSILSQFKKEIFGIKYLE